MRPSLDLRCLKEASWKEHALRFLFGGLIAALAGLVGNALGPLVGGALLAFPAILPASLTLAKKHAGKKAAMDEAKGATLASVALAAFGAVTMTATKLPFAMSLALALAAWVLVAGGLWAFVHARRQSRSD